MAPNTLLGEGHVTRKVHSPETSIVGSGNRGVQGHRIRHYWGCWTKPLFSEGFELAMQSLVAAGGLWKGLPESLVHTEERSLAMGGQPLVPSTGLPPQPPRPGAQLHLHSSDKEPILFLSI